MQSNTATLPNANAQTLTPELLWKMDAYWRAANYLAVGQLYLKAADAGHGQDLPEIRNWKWGNTKVTERY